MDSASPPRAAADARLQMAAVLDASDDAIAIVDLDGRVQAWNRGARRIYGYASDEMVDQWMGVIVPPDRRVELDRMLATIRANERVEPFDTVRQARGGQPLDVQISAVPVVDRAGQVAGAVITSRDLTAQRRAERALGRSEARWRAIVDSAVDAIILIDRHGRIESFNPAASRMFGHAPDAVIGRNISMLMPDPYASEHDHYLRRYQMTGERRIIGIGREVTALRKDGSTFPAHLTVGEIDLDGVPMYSGIIRDLTERVSLETRLREESGLVRLGELAAVLAHEVKNPLAAVSGAVQVLGEHLTDQEDREIVQEILRRLDGLGALMTDLLIYARPPRPRRSPVDVTELLKALTHLLAADPAWRALRVTIDGGLRRLHADPELLKVVLQNLLLNAAQAMQGRGDIVVSLRQVENVAHIDVADGGPGIAPDVREKVFTPFFTTKAKGTGLGLPTVRRIVEAHGGQVMVVRSGSEGTTVRLTLPAGSSPASELA
jgi:two-component system sensor kinase FixL